MYPVCLHKTNFNLNLPLLPRNFSKEEGVLFQWNFLPETEVAFKAMSLTNFQVLSDHLFYHIAKSEA